MKTMNDVLEFINRAIKEKCKIASSIGYCVHVENTDNFVYFSLIGTKLYIDTTKKGRFIIDNLTDKEILQYRTIFEDCREYQAYVGEEIFDNFFQENNTITNINQLDEED